MLGSYPVRPVGRTAQEGSLLRQDGSLRRGGLVDVGHFHGGLERHPVGRRRAAAVARRREAHQETVVKTGEGRNPGDPEPYKIVERVIRVDQAGEFGAVRIYEGQLAALRWTGRSRGDAGRKIAALARAE